MKPDSLKTDAGSTGWSHAIFYVVLLGLTLRVINFVLSADNPLLYMPVLDEKYYIAAAKVISEGNWMNQGTGAFMDPAYSYFLGIIFFLFGDNLTTVRLIQIVLDSVSILLIYAIGVKLWNKSSGMTAAVCYAVYPVAFFYSLLILKTTLTITSLLFFVWLFLKAVEMRRLTIWYIIGFFSGLMIYLRANLILIVPFTLLYMLFFFRPLRINVWVRMSVFLFGVVTMIALNGLRGYFTGNEHFLFNTQSGRLFYSSNNPENLTGRYNVPSFARPDPELSEKDFKRQAEHRLGKRLNPRQVSNYWRDEAISFLVKHPAEILQLLFNKIKWTISNCEIPNNQSYYVASQFSPLIRWHFPCFAFIFALGIPGVVWGIIRSRKTCVLLIPLLTVLVTILIFYSSSRFRMPAVPFLCLGAGITVCLIIEFLKKAAWVKIGSIGVSIMILCALSLAIPCPAQRGNEAFFLAKAYWTIGEYGMAHDVAIKGMKRYPKQPRFYNLLGMISASEAKTHEAMLYYRNALRLEPHFTDVYHNMGLLYLSMETPLEAIACFQKALSFEARADSCYFLARAYEEIGDLSAAMKNYQRCIMLADKESSISKLARGKLSELEKSS